MPAQTSTELLTRSCPNGRAIYANIKPGDGAFRCPLRGHLGVIQHTIGSPRFIQMGFHLEFRRDRHASIGLLAYRMLSTVSLTGRLPAGDAQRQQARVAVLGQGSVKTLDGGSCGHVRDGARGVEMR